MRVSRVVLVVCSLSSILATEQSLPQFAAPPRPPLSYGGNGGGGGGGGYGIGGVGGGGANGNGGYSGNGGSYQQYAPQLQSSPSQQYAPQPQPRYPIGNQCGTQVGTCLTNEPGQVGSFCLCTTQEGEQVSGVIR